MLMISRSPEHTYYGPPKEKAEFEDMLFEPDRSSLLVEQITHRSLVRNIHIVLQIVVR
jgi:predicted lipoprotein